MEKDITIFIQSFADLELFKPIIKEAEKRGYKTQITKEPQKKCEIGIYCQHINYPENSKFSVIMLHDLIQAYPRWPDIWEKEPWNKYDIGLLPAKFWINMWKNATYKPWTKPRLGVYEAGWTKADITVKQEFIDAVSKLSEELNLDKTKKTILYAPSWENDNKQDDFVQAVLPLNVNILIKQSTTENECKEWATTWSVFWEMYNAIVRMNELHKNIPNVHILDPKINIFSVIALADILVSEESSTMCESVLMGKPTIAVEDWLIPDTVPSRTACKGHAFTIKATKNTLKETIKDVLEQYEIYQQKAIEFKNNNFLPIGNNSKIVMDIIDAAVNGKTISYKKEEQISLPLVEIENQLIQANDKILKLNTDIEILQNKADPVRFCVFYFDTGNNINEKEKIIIYHKKDTINFCHEIELPHNIKSIRFDPVYDCRCFVQSLVIKTDTGKSLKFRVLNGVKSKNDGIIFTTPDPHIFIIFNKKPVKKIIIKCNIWFIN